MHVLVTGASSGIGAAITVEYLRRSAHVTLVARRRDRLEALAATPGAHCHVIAADLGDHACAPDVVAQAEEALGPIDVLVNNAGVQILGHMHESPWPDAENLFKVNVFAPLRLTMAALPRMIARGRGTIVDVASMAALAPTPGMAFYNAAKAALGAASEGLRAEVAPHGIHVVTVYPGPVRSDMETEARERFAHGPLVSRIPTGSPDVLARLVAEAVDRKLPRVIYPKLYGLGRLFPGVTRWVVDRFTPPLRQ